MYICVRFELIFSTGQVAPKPDSPVQNLTVRFKTGHLQGNPTHSWVFFFWGGPLRGKAGEKAGA